MAIFTVEGEDTKAQWMQNYLRTMGGWPPEEEEPSIEQLSALYRRLTTQDVAPFTDFAVFEPFGQRMARASRFRTYILTAGGYTVKELPGPATFVQWRAAFRVLRSALIMSDAVGLANLHGYEMVIERLPEMLAPVLQRRRAGTVFPFKQVEIKDENGHKSRETYTFELGRQKAMGLGVWGHHHGQRVLAHASPRARTGLDGKWIQGQAAYPSRTGRSGLFARWGGRDHGDGGEREHKSGSGFEVQEQNKGTKGCSKTEDGGGQSGTCQTLLKGRRQGQERANN